MDFQVIKNKYLIDSDCPIAIGNADEIKWLIDTVEQLQANEEILMEQNKKLRQQIHSFRCKTTYMVFEENLRLALELALIKGEMSG